MRQLGASALATATLDTCSKSCFTRHVAWENAQDKAHPSMVSTPAQLHHPAVLCYASCPQENAKCIFFLSKRHIHCRDILFSDTNAFGALSL